MRTLLAITALLALASCTDDPTEPTADPTRTPTTAATAATTSESGTPPAPPVLDDPEPDVVTTEFPEDVALPEHGGHYFAVVLSAGGPEAIDESVRAVAAYGYAAGIGDVDCLQGAREVYEIPGGTAVSYLLFADLEHAYRFTDAYAVAEDGVQMGIAEVTTYCLD